MMRVQTNDEFQETLKTTIAPFEEKYDDQIDVVVRSLLLMWKKRHDALFSPELKLATERGILSIQSWAQDLPPHERMFVAEHEFLEESLSGMIERLQDPSRVALLDPTLTTSYGRTLPVDDRLKVRPSLIANAIISRLVGLDDLPMIEVLDLRNDLKDYLPYFRSEMIKLSEEIVEIESEQLAVELDLRWHRDLAPIMEEIRREVAAARYPRRLLDAVTSDRGAMAATAGALAIAAGGLVVGLGALIPALAVAAYPFLKAKTSSSELMEKARMHKLFFLYELHSRIAT